MRQGLRNTLQSLSCIATEFNGTQTDAVMIAVPIGNYVGCCLVIAVQQKITVSV